jgi:hypothetical protein
MVDLKKLVQHHAIGDPTLLPTWPESDKIALICGEYHNDVIRFSVIQSQSELEKKLAAITQRQVLFFNVLKSDFDK